MGFVLCAHTRSVRPAAMMIALTTVLIGVACFALPVQAAPAAPNDVTLPQPDGSTIQARQWGDEWQHGYETLDGYTILPDAGSGFWVYAVESSDTLVPARVDGQMLIVGRDQPQGIQPGVRPAQDLSSGQNFSPEFLPTPLQAQAPEFTPNQGTQRLLLLLVGFSDRPGTYPAAGFQTSFFGANNSVMSYYRQASFNKLLLAPAAETHGTANDGVIGWINLPYAHPNDTDLAPKIVNDALTAANPYINYASFDANKDGYISYTELHVVVVTAGYEESVSGSFGPAPRMWAHRWSLDGGGYNPILDGVHLGQATRDGGYTIFGETHYFSPTQVHAATIGVMVHELGHDLSWPDLYDINRLSEGVGSWSIMGAGSWNTANPASFMFGDTPAMPDAFLRYYQGWLAPVALYDGQTINLLPAEKNPSALLVGRNPGGVDWNFRTRSGTGEYWLVEYRKLEGFDRGLPGCGLLIWHIDETVTFDNYANAFRDHPLIELEQADGLRDLYYHYNRGDAGDPYPGLSGNLSFSNTSSPNSHFYNGSNSGRGVSVLSNTCGASMTVRYNGPEVFGVTIFIPSLQK